MGIHKLYSFIKNSATKTVSIQDEIIAFRRKHNIKEPIIVVDFNACLRNFIGNEQLYGGQSTKCTARAQKFCKYIQALGVKLVFFLEGPIKPEKLEEWTERRNRDYKDEQRILEKIRSNNSNYRNLKDCKFVGTAYDCVQIVLKQNKCGHEISLKNECDLDLCKYANDNNAMAVIASDTDFIAMPGDWDVWFSYDVNIAQMTVKKIDKAQLRRSLGLSKSQMPIFATFCGNDFIKYETMLKDFKFAEGMTYFNRHILIAEFIRNYSMDEPDANLIAKCIRKKTKSRLPLSLILDCVKKSLNFYNCVFEPESSIQGLEWLQEFTKETFITLIYTIKMKLPFTIAPKMIDLELTDFTPFAQLVLPIVRRQAGIVLADETNRDQKLEIYFKYDRLQPYRKHIESPEYPPFATPSIKDLVGKEPSNQISEETKIEIFSWMIFNDKATLKPPKWSRILREFTKFFLPIVTMYYLIKKEQIEIFEADSVLASVENVINLSDYERRQIAIPANNPTARAAWLAFTYPQLNYHFRNALSIAGLGDYLELEYFDGYVYHSMYDKMEKNIPGRETIISAIKALRLYANQ